MRRCTGAGGHVPAAACARGAGEACAAAGGSCELLRDGFYLLSGLSVCLGLLILVMLRRVLPRLEAAMLPLARRGLLRLQGAG